MATIAGHYIGPGPSGAVACAAGGSVTFRLTGDFPRARLDIQRSPDGKAWSSMPIETDTLRNVRPTNDPLTGRFPYVESAPWLRVVLVELESGWATWKLSNE